MKTNVMKSDPVKTDLTIEDTPNGERIARITDKEIKNKGGKRITIKHNREKGSVSIHYRGKLIYVRGTCGGSLIIEGNVKPHDITVKGLLHQLP